eukprot:TRINITY_DN6232_c0_g1_i1.p1 TRINITY_DN6232_c0_g1~~TRINITY_DN6232_c0_g1_i1.p1  ORF type:complete len:264 (+),score=21.81 TRINITY_DN6232_c0_g1_i1:44-793(+)
MVASDASSSAGSVTAHGSDSSEASPNHSAETKRSCRRGGRRNRCCCDASGDGFKMPRCSGTAAVGGGPSWADDDPECSQMDFDVPPERFMARRRTQAPCSHNDWKKVGKKRDRLVLMCRREDCMLGADGGRTIWRIYPGEYGKCKAFYAGACHKGSDCPHPHVHKKVPVSGSRVYAVSRGPQIGVFVGDYHQVEQFLTGCPTKVVTRHESVEAAETHLRQVLSIVDVPKLEYAAEPHTQSSAAAKPRSP